MSNVDEDFISELSGYAFKINYEEPILVSNFTKSLNAFNHLYSLIAESEEGNNIYLGLRRKSHGLCIRSIEKGSILTFLSDVNPMTILNVVGAIASIISLILSFGKKQETNITINNYLFLNFDQICDDLESIVQIIRNSKESIEFYSEKGTVIYHENGSFSEKKSLIIDFDEKQQIINNIERIRYIKKMKEEGGINRPLGKEEKVC